MTLNFIQTPPKNLFFTGKGGVGKTTTSAATGTAIDVSDDVEASLLDRSFEMQE